VLSSLLLLPTVYFAYGEEERTRKLRSLLGTGGIRARLLGRVRAPKRGGGEEMEVFEAFDSLLAAASGACCSPLAVFIQIQVGTFDRFFMVLAYL
ncbi:hypothetical protein GW17_00036564, partial [Ensete ventricosum]